LQIVLNFVNFLKIRYRVSGIRFQVLGNGYWMPGTWQMDAGGRRQEAGAEPHRGESMVAERIVPFISRAKESINQY
jgi:hypothetical protein